MYNQANSNIIYVYLDNLFNNKYLKLFLFIIITVRNNSVHIRKNIKKKYFKLNHEQKQNQMYK